MRSFTAQIAGYRVWVTIASTRSPYALMLLARPMMPAPASPSSASPAKTTACTPTILAALFANSGRLKLTYSRSGPPRSSTNRIRYGEACTATAAPANRPAIVPMTRLQ